MKPINVELTMGHNIGVSASYYKPREREVLEDYLKATDLLTINSDSKLLQKQVEELKERSTDNEYIIKAKLHEKDEQIHILNKKQEKFEQLIQTLTTRCKSCGTCHLITLIGGKLVNQAYR